MIYTEYFFSMVDLRLLKKSFLGLSVGVLILIPIDLARVAFGAKPAASISHMEKFVPNLSSSEPVSSYEEAFKRSTLFGLATSDAALPVFKSSIAELMKDYRLKGVIILDEPEAIIEDARTQKSSFVRQGDKLGDLTVKEIKEGALVLSYYGEEKEMRIE